MSEVTSVAAVVAAAVFVEIVPILINNENYTSVSLILKNAQDHTNMCTET